MAPAQAIPSDRLATLLAEGTGYPNCLLVDVRDDSDRVAGGSIAGSARVPHQVFLRHIGEWANEARKHATVVLYCQYGQSRSVRCAEELGALLAQGSRDPREPQGETVSTEVYYLEGGFSTFMTQHPEFVEYA